MVILATLFYMCIITYSLLNVKMCTKNVQGGKLFDNLISVIIVNYSQNNNVILTLQRGG